MHIPYTTLFRSSHDQTKAAHISKDNIQKIVEHIKSFTFTVNGSLPIEKAFVTGGGVATEEIVPSTMQSKLTNRLFFSGEILNIHGYKIGRASCRKECSE